MSIFIHDCIECQQKKHINQKIQTATKQTFSEIASYFNYRISKDTKGPINPINNSSSSSTHSFQTLPEYSAYLNSDTDILDFSPSNPSPFAPYSPDRIITTPNNTPKLQTHTTTAQSQNLPFLETNSPASDSCDESLISKVQDTSSIINRPPLPPIPTTRTLHIPEPDSVLQYISSCSHRIPTATNTIRKTPISTLPKNTPIPSTSQTPIKQNHDLVLQKNYHWLQNNERPLQIDPTIASNSLLSVYYKLFHQLYINHETF